MGKSLSKLSPHIFDRNRCDSDMIYWWNERPVIAGHNESNCLGFFVHVSHCMDWSS